MSSTGRLLFVLGNELPTGVDVSIAIFSVCTNLKSQKMKSTIHSYSLALIEVWTKAFGQKHVMSKSAVIKKLEKVVNSYYNHVYNKAHRIKPKTATSSMDRKSMRQLNRDWRTMTDTKTGVSNGTLFDIGRDVESFTGDERAFYLDQKGKREGRLSEDIDDEFEAIQEARYNAELEEQGREDAELTYAMGEDQMNESITSNDNEVTDMNSSLASNDSRLDQSMNRSGLVRIAKDGTERGVQTEPAVPDCPKLRVKAKVCTDKIKATCANVSSVCGVSVETSRLAVKTVCKELYGHDVFLSPPSKTTDQTESEPPSKKSCIPLSAADYAQYQYVLPSARTISDYKQMQASQVERDAAVALLTKPDKNKSTLHYDTTSRNAIDGEWPSIIIILSDGTEYVLRPIFFAYEDRDQIVELLVETYYRLADAASVVTGSIITAATLWEKTNAIMTDSVSKNLNIEVLIGQKLNSDHRPYHLLCKSHPVQKLDATNLDVLSRMEKMVKQRDVFESINPSLKSFFRGKSTVLETGIDALLTLVSHDKSGKSCSLADVFDQICEREQVKKRIFLYQQRRFAKLGKAAAAIVDVYPILIMLLDEASSTNQLTEACMIYLSSEFFFTELQTLAFFNHKVTFPYLNCVEKSTQTDLLTILPQLYRDLLQKKTDTLKDFIVDIPGVTIKDPTSELAQKIIKMMCIAAAEGLKLQCGREYGFSDPDQNPRATVLTALSENELQGLPTNNLAAERNLAVFDKRASKVAKCRNYKFSAKSIRNDMLLYKGTQNTVDRITQKITAVLSAREKVWNAQQKQKMKERIELKLQKAVKAKDYVKKLLNDCKSWSGPCTSVDELLHIVRVKPDQAEFIVKTEMAYYAHTHKSDKIQRPDLFKMNGITHEEKLENLIVLLYDDNQDSTASIANLPSNNDVLKALSSENALTNSASEHDIQINQQCVVCWSDAASGKYVWYIGYVKDKKDDMYTIDHLSREIPGSNKIWRYPLKEDIQDAEEDQILDITVEGQWNLADSRNPKFTLVNEKQIAFVFKNNFGRSRCV